MTDRTNFIIEEGSQSIDNLVDVSAEIDQVHRNLSQTVIITTEDKLRLSLDKHIRILTDRQAWLTPSGILLATLTTLITADFKDYIFTADIWEALFIIISVLSFVWLILALNKLRRSTDIDVIIEELKPTLTSPRNTRSNE